MASVKLTKAVKASIAEKAAKDLFLSSLLEHWKIVEEQFTSMVKETFKDFDWEHVEPYRAYIYWHSEIQLLQLPVEWRIHWDDFRKLMGLPSIECISLSFVYPSRRSSGDCLECTSNKQVAGILRPYMVKYFTAKKYYMDIVQILLGLSTYRQLEDTVPELAKYLPGTAVEAVTALVPIEQINRVRNLLQNQVPKTDAGEEQKV
jgi:hypothetical protein